MGNVFASLILTGIATALVVTWNRFVGPRPDRLRPAVVDHATGVTGVMRIAPFDDAARFGVRGEMPSASCSQEPDEFDLFVGSVGLLRLVLTHPPAGHNSPFSILTMTDEDAATGPPIGRVAAWPVPGSGQGRHAGLVDWVIEVDGHLLTLRVDHYPHVLRRPQRLLRSDDGQSWCASLYAHWHPYTFTAGIEVVLPPDVSMRGIVFCLAFLYFLDGVLSAPKLMRPRRRPATAAGSREHLREVLGRAMSRLDMLNDRGPVQMRQELPL